MLVSQGYLQLTDTGTSSNAYLFVRLTEFLSNYKTQRKPLAKWPHHVCQIVNIYLPSKLFACTALSQKLPGEVFVEENVATCPPGVSKDVLVPFSTE